MPEDEESVNKDDDDDMDFNDDSFADKKKKKKKKKVNVDDLDDGDADKVCTEWSALHTKIPNWVSWSQFAQNEVTFLWILLDMKIFFVYRRTRERETPRILGRDLIEITFTMSCSR